MTPDRLFGWFALGLIVVAVVAGFRIIGSPNHARLVAVDARRSTDIAGLAGAIDTYARSHDNGVPKRITDLPEDEFNARNDPVTGRVYEYHDLGRTRYSLCAVFSTETGAEFEPQWGLLRKHGKGRVCFSYDVTRPRSVAE